MIKYTSNEGFFYTTKATFTDNGNIVEQYTDSRNYYEDLVSKWGHLSNLIFTDVVPTQSQIDRLDILNNIEAENKQAWTGSSALFVEHGIIMPDDDSFLTALEPNYKESTLNYFRQLRREELKTQRDNAIDEPINNVQVGRITDRENIQGTIANWDTLGLGLTINWIMFDNTVQALSKADLEAIYVGYGLRKAQCFGLYEQAIAGLNSAQTIEEVMNIQFGE